jgi:hypothetical protein
MQLPHYRSQPAASTRTAAPLRHLQNVEYGLRADPLDAVVTDLAAHAFQAKPPWVIPSGERFGARLFQHTYP